VLKLHGSRRRIVDRYASAGKRLRDLDLSTHQALKFSQFVARLWEVFVLVLVEIISLFYEISRSQDFYGHRSLTLTFDPVTFSMPPVSCGPGSD